MKIFGEHFFDKEDRFFDEPMFDKSTEEEKPKEKIVQTSKGVGRFISSVEIGAKVKKDQLIGFLFVAGVKKEIKAEVSGTIKEILPEYKTGYVAVEREKQHNGEQITSTSVEYGQPLFVIEKEGFSSDKTDK